MTQDPELPAQQTNISEEAPLFKTRYPRTKLRIKARRGHKTHQITSQQGVVRYPKRKMR